MTTNTNEHYLGELPFYNITPIELYETLESIQGKINNCLENNNFQHFLAQNLPEQLNSEE